jgi:hypothetical protein
MFTILLQQRVTPVTTDIQLIVFKPALARSLEIDYGV